MKIIYYLLWFVFAVACFNFGTFFFDTFYYLGQENYDAAFKCAIAAILIFCVAALSFLYLVSKK